MLLQLDQQGSGKQSKGVQEHVGGQTDLSARGWQPRLFQFGEEEANYGRWPYPVIPRTLPDIPRYWVVTAQKN